jgi:hypothetical protein
MGVAQVRIRVAVRDPTTEGIVQRARHVTAQNVVLIEPVLMHLVEVDPAPNVTTTVAARKVDLSDATTIPESDATRAPTMSVVRVPVAPGVRAVMVVRWPVRQEVTHGRRILAAQILIFDARRAMVNVTNATVDHHARAVMVVRWPVRQEVTHGRRILAAQILIFDARRAMVIVTNATVDHHARAATKDRRVVARVDHCAT